jgi:hypothetical protein
VFDAEVGAVAGEEAPGVVDGLADADADVGDDFVGDGGWLDEAAAGGAAFACHGEAVMAAVDAEGEGKLAGAGAEFVEFFAVAALLHFLDAAGGLEGADEDEAVLGAAFDEEVEEPVHAVVEIDVGGAGRVFFYELAGAGAGGGVGGEIAFHGVGFGFDDDAGAAFPDELDADEVAGDGEDVALEKITGQIAHGLQTGGMIHKFPRDAELGLDVGGEGFDAEGLGGVVAAVDEIDADFFGEGVAPVGAFAGDEGVDAGLGDGGDFGACAAGHDADFPAGGGATRADMHAGAGGGGEALHEFIAADFGLDLRAVFGALGLHEIAAGFEAEGAGEDGVVAEGGMEIEGEVAAVNGESGIERGFDFLEDGAGPGLEAGPEHAVVDDEQIGTCGDGFFDHGQGGIHGGDDLGDFTFAVFELQAVEGVGVVGDLCDAQFGVEMGDEVGEIHAGQFGWFG